MQKDEELIELSPVFEEESPFEEREKKKQKKDLEEKNENKELKDLYGKLKEKIDPKCVGLDYGAYKSHFSSIINDEIKTTPENSSFESVILLGVKKVSNSGQMLTTSFLDEDIHRIYTEQELNNIVYHLKNKLGYQLYDNKYKKKDKKKEPENKPNLSIQTDQKTFQTPATVAFNKSIITFFTKYKDYPFMKDILNEKTDILLSHPNYFSLSQVAAFKFSFQDTIPHAIPNWEGNLYLYSESECALFSILKDIQIADSIIVDQGDSTTNVSSIRFKSVDGVLHISMYHDGIMVGGHACSQVVQSLVEKDLKHVYKGSLPLDVLHILRRNYTNIKISLIKEEQVEKYKSEVKGIPFTVDRSEFLHKCEDVYNTVDQFISTHIKKTGIDPSNIIYTGGGLRNPLQRKYLEDHVFAPFLEKGAKLFPDNLEKRVVEGLHYRHALEKIGGIIIEETCPYSIYTVIKSKPSDTQIHYELQIVLPKGKNSFTSAPILFEPANKEVIYPLYQVDSTQDVIPFKKHPGLEMLEIGTLKFPCDSDNKWNAKFSAKWDNKKLYFKVQDHEKSIDIDFEMFRDMSKVTFSSVVKEYD